MTNTTTESGIRTCRRPINLGLLGLLVCTLHTSPLHAGVTFTFQEVGNDVVATTSGTIASGWSINFGKFSTASSAYLVTDSIRGAEDGGLRWVSQNNHWTLNNTLNGVTGNFIGVLTGDAFGFANDGNLYTSAGINEGDAITPNTTITWWNHTFTSLGLDTSLSTTPLVLFTLDNGETISAARASGGAAVPEPSSLALLGCGGVVVSCVRRWRSKREGASAA